jgi:hypothetical protein
MNVTLLNKSAQAFRISAARPFSVAYNVKSKFETAYNQKMETLKKVPEKM